MMTTVSRDTLPEFGEAHIMVVEPTYVGSPSGADVLAIDEAVLRQQDDLIAWNLRVQQAKDGCTAASQYVICLAGNCVTAAKYPVYWMGYQDIKECASEETKSNISETIDVAAQGIVDATRGADALVRQSPSGTVAATTTSLILVADLASTSIPAYMMTTAGLTCLNLMLQRQFMSLLSRMKAKDAEDAEDDEDALDDDWVICLRIGDSALRTIPDDDWELVEYRELFQSCCGDVVIPDQHSLDLFRSCQGDD